MFPNIIYKLLDPVTKEIHYIGYTSDEIIRFNKHCMGDTGTKQKQIWIRRLKKQGLKPIMEIVTVYPDPAMLPQAEIVWYNAFKNAGCDLYQDQKWVGSNSGKGSKRSEEVLSKMSESHKGNKSRTGMKNSDQWFEKVVGRKDSEETKLNKSEAQKARWASYTNEERKQMSLQMTGENNPNYKDGKRMKNKELTMKQLKNKGVS